MKNILNKVYFHPIFLLVLLIFVLIGRFKFIIIFMMLILIHELGHILMSLLFKWEIEKVIILPFGGLTKYNQLINTPLREEFLVSISGIIIQLIFYKFTCYYIDYKYYSLINYFVIIFNLIPIHPLDGSKILNILFNKMLSYKSSFLLTIIISNIFIIIFSLFLFNINKLFIFIFIFLYKEVNKMYKERNLIFNKFLLERYLNEFNFKKEKIINRIEKMKKDYKHIFYIENKYITEKSYLKTYYNYLTK